ncbi:MAG TPA: hypothetical protein PLO33_17625 [Kouleothrix sp.]|uniref:hypothetical protein n=1 Tax=Kouleothrix sp. TaxID=2779161 RepID=UPI002BDD5838|nr:hypothetical protein [Kouleothrix sp.]HRC77508.1 hypothetical protein [Kouleothrix sp.]
MVSKHFPPDTLDQASSVLVACKQIDPGLRSGAITQDSYGQMIGEARTSQTQITELELHLKELRNRRDDQLANVWDATKRIRTTVKGVYGDNSSEYQLVGGTRMSERKRPARRATPPPDADAA